jgi:hypothetical protein
MIKQFEENYSVRDKQNVFFGHMRLTIYLHHNLGTKKSFQMPLVRINGTIIKLNGLLDDYLNK